MTVGRAGQLRAVEGVLAGAGYAYRPVHQVRPEIGQRQEP